MRSKNNPENSYELSKRELDVMNVFWSQEGSVIASDIPKVNQSLSINTVQAVIKKLIAKNYLKIDEIVYSGTVLTRSYLPIVSAEEYAKRQIKTDASFLSKYANKIQVISALLDSEENEAQLIADLEALLNERKKNLK